MEISPRRLIEMTDSCYGPNGIVEVSEIVCYYIIVLETDSSIIRAKIDTFTGV